MKIENINDFNSILKNAENGNSEAMNKVAEIYESGLIIDKNEIIENNEQLSFEWTKKSYENGNIEATEKYADYLSVNDNQFCEQNIELAMKLYEKAMNCGSENATFSLGIEYRNKRNFVKAFELYEKSNNKFTIGLCQYYGIGTKKDKLKSLELFKSLNLKNNSEYEIDEANYLIGKIYLEGEVIKQSFEKARYYLELANKDGDHRSSQEILHIIGNENETPTANTV